MNLHDKVVVVTGAGTGIGRATALAFAAEGARVAACSLHQETLDSLATELGERALLLRKVDVAKRDEMAAFAAEVHAKVAAVDVLVNNAGVAIGGAFVDTSLDDWNWLLGINLYGVIHGCHYFIPKMIERGLGGQVVNVSSVFGIYPAPSSSAYVTSKFAVRGLSMSIRGELASHGIGVTAICPGLVATSIIEHSRTVGDIDERRGLLRDVFMHGASPTKVASAIVDAVHTNPAVRVVGIDAHLLSGLSRLAPRMLDRVGGTLSRTLVRSREWQPRRGQMAASRGP